MEFGVGQSYDGMGADSRNQRRRQLRRRAHDHENLFVVGAPTTPTGGLYQRHAHVRRADAALRSGDR